MTISDFRSRRALHRLELYHEFFKPHGIECQCSFGIAGDGYVGVALNRATRDFTRAERWFLDLLRPHIASAYAAVRARGLTRCETEILSLVALDYTSEQIASALSVSVRTVDKHVEHALDKLAVHSRREAVQRLRDW